MGRVKVAGTRTYKDFYQFFKWDWEYYNQMADFDFTTGDYDDFECPPDFPDCMDAIYDNWYDFYYMDEPVEDDFEMPTYDELAEAFRGLGIDTFNDAVYDYMMWEFAPEDDPQTIDILMEML